MTLAERFWPKVVRADPDDDAWNGGSACWYWTGSTQHGYGWMGLGRREDGNEYAHRVAFLITNGRLPRAHTMHACDVRSCVRSDHLGEGTRAENLQDMMRKGRGRRQFGAGEEHPQVKLSEAIVRYVRNSVESHEALAAELGVHASHILRIRARQVWRHVLAVILVLLSVVCQSCAMGRVRTPEGLEISGVALGCACVGICATACIETPDDDIMPPPQPATTKIEGGAFSSRASAMWGAFIGAVSSALVYVAW